MFIGELNCLIQASTDGLSSICPPIHLRPHFYISNGPSSENVHEIDGLSSSTVHLRPSRTNNHGLSSEFVRVAKLAERSEIPLNLTNDVNMTRFVPTLEFVHELDSRSSSGRSPPSFYAK